jgi:hypothetical protein
MAALLARASLLDNAMRRWLYRLEVVVVAIAVAASAIAWGWGVVGRWFWLQIRNFVAIKVLEQHGDEAPRHIAERIGALALDGDELGIEVWRKIAARVDQLNQRSSIQ